MPRKIQNGFFITLEGPEGAGKSTQVRLLAESLRERGYAVLETREPGGTGLGEELRGLLKHYEGPAPVCPEAELLMFGASRAQLMREVILPHLEAGGVVVCDRFADSTTVYQGVGRALDLGFIQAMHELTVQHRWPDMTILLDLDVEAGFSRADRRGRPEGMVDRFEDEIREFHHAVRAGFVGLAQANPQRIRVVDAAQSPHEVHQQIMECVDGAID